MLVTTLLNFLMECSDGTLPSVSSSANDDVSCYRISLDFFNYSYYVGNYRRKIFCR
jgi:hypothetical protein